MTDSESLASVRPEASSDTSAARLTGAIAAYVRARDSNRPHLMKAAFTDAAVLQIHVEPGTPHLQSGLVGRKAIVESLVTRFNQAWENIYTLCIGARPAAEVEAFSCAWLGVMCSKSDGSCRIGWGRYDWIFDLDSQRARSLVIVVSAMKVVTTDVGPLIDWVSLLPYPWCDGSAIMAAPPPILHARSILDHLEAARIHARARSS